MAPAKEKSTETMLEEYGDDNDLQPTFREKRRVYDVLRTL